MHMKSIVIGISMAAFLWSDASVASEPKHAAPSAAASTATALPSDTAVDSGSQAREVKLARRRSRRAKAKAKPPTPVAEAPAEAPPSTSIAEREAQGTESAPIAAGRGRPSRVEFDERLIRGQTNKADAIYLFERRSSELRTLVKKRKHFHREIDETLD